VLVALEDAEARAMLAAGETAGAHILLARAHARLGRCPALEVREAEVALSREEPELARGALAGALDSQDTERPAIGLLPATRLEAWLLQALSEQQDGEHEAAARALENALELAEQEQICGPFLTGGRATQQLLERHAQRGTEHPALLEILLDGLGGRPGGNEAALLAAPLTDRELKILRYLPTMLSNAEIGAEIFVSLNTVKTHLRSIYRKLDASSRADAVQRARALDLLPRGIRRPRVAQRP
jgi:LuxR family maltose regulon positive regulatory protein